MYAELHLGSAAGCTEVAAFAWDERPDVQPIQAWQLRKHRPELLQLLHAGLLISARFPPASGRGKLLNYVPHPSRLTHYAEVRLTMLWGNRSAILPSQV